MLLGGGAVCFAYVMAGGVWPLGFISDPRPAIPYATHPQARLCIAAAWQCGVFV